MKEVLQIAYLRHLQDFYLFESVKDGIILYHILPEVRSTLSGAPSKRGASSAAGSLTVA